jgi:hypothetical protein
MNMQAYAARLEILKWRDEQLGAVTDQLEEHLPALLDDISHHLDAAGAFKSIKMSVGMKRSVAKIVGGWQDDQMATAVHRAQASLDDTLAGLGDELAMDVGNKDAILSVLGATAGMAMIAGSFSTVPTLIGAAAATGGVFGFFMTAPVITLPVLGIGLAGIGLMTVTGSTVMRKSYVSAKAKLREKILTSVEQAVMGYGQSLEVRTVLTDIQAAIILTGEKKIEELK